MRADNFTIGQVRYNPGTESFEALAQYNHGGEVFDYAVSVRAPLTAQYRLITRRLTEAAHRAHSQAIGGIRLRRSFDDSPLAA